VDVAIRLWNEHQFERARHCALSDDGNRKHFMLIANLPACAAMDSRSRVRRLLSGREQVFGVGANIVQPLAAA